MSQSEVHKEANKLQCKIRWCPRYRVVQKPLGKQSTKNEDRLQSMWICQKKNNWDPNDKSRSINCGYSRVKCLVFHILRISVLGNEARHANNDTNSWVLGTELINRSKTRSYGIPYDTHMRLLCWTINCKPLAQGLPLLSTCTRDRPTKPPFLLILYSAETEGLQLLARCIEQDE